MATAYGVRLTHERWRRGGYDGEGVDAARPGLLHPVQRLAHAMHAEAARIELVALAVRAAWMTSWPRLALVIRAQ